MDTITLETEGPVATITLNRPEVHNAFDDLLIAELTETYRALSDIAAIRVIVLQGAGISFCAGADLNWMRRMADYTHEDNRADAWALQKMFDAIYRCPKVTIARVHGAAIGGGVGLVVACDIAIASEEAKFALSEVRLGIVPAVISPYVVEKIGYGACRAYFVTGERIEAAEALRIGLVQQVTPAAELDAAVQKKVGFARQAGPEAVRTAKELLRIIANRTPEEAAAQTVKCIADLRVSPEGQEGIRAFLEKRNPDFAE